MTNKTNDYNSSIKPRQKVISELYEEHLNLIIMKKELISGIFSLSMLTATQAATFILGDGLPNDSSVIASNITDNTPASFVTFSDGTNPVVREDSNSSINTVQFSQVFGSNGNEIIPNTVNNFNPFVAGELPLYNGTTDIFRTVSTFDLSNLVIPTGETITGLSLFLEVSQAPLVGSEVLSIFDGSFIGGTTLPTTAIASRDFSTAPAGVGNFFEFDLTDITIAPDDTFTFTLASTGANNESLFFGSDISSEGTDTGTLFTSTAPILVVTTGVVPEPSAGLLLSASALLMCSRRKRKNT